MSLINDALKTAQRERSVQSGVGPGGQPLLEGFFPYVSTSSPARRSKLTRLAIMAAVSIVVLGVAAWFTVPSIKRSLDARQAKAPSIVLPERPTASQPETPTQVAVVTDTQPTAVAAPDSVAVPASEPAPAAPPTRRAAKRSPLAQPRSSVSASEPVAVPRDTTVVDPSSAIADAPEHRSTSRPNFEAEAVAAFNAGDYPTARSRFEMAVRATPTASAWTNYGVTLEKLGQPQAAIRAYRAAMGIDPNYFNAWLYLARVYNALGDVTQAIPLFDRAHEIDPTNSDVNADLAELEYQAGAFSEARRYADVATRSNPANGRAQYYLALSADTLKDRGVARQAFENYLRTMAGQEKDNAASVGYARIRVQELRDKP
jgi:Flp pilus assembly protein TadD